MNDNEDDIAQVMTELVFKARHLINEYVGPPYRSADWLAGEMVDLLGPIHGPETAA